MSNQQALLSPVKLGNLALKHRVVLAPLARYRCTPEAVPNDLVKEYYQQRASEGGLLITEATLITRLAGNYPRAPGIWNKEQIEGWKQVTDAVHKKRGYIYCQLWHTGRVGFSHLNPNHEQPVAPSDVPVNGCDAAGNRYEIPHALTMDEIKALIQDYRQAALNAIEAGFDGVELHGANGYLIDQFINSNSNKRTDSYGGSIENRARFVLELIDAVVEAIGAERTAIRFSPGGKYQDMGDETEVETWSYLTREIQKKHPNLSYLHFIETRVDLFFEDPTFVDSLQPYRDLWKGAFITNGLSNNIPEAFDLAERTGDLISFGRSFIANPDLPERLRHGWELNRYDRSTFYTHDAAGYTDYPFYNKK